MPAMKCCKPRAAVLAKSCGGENEAQEIASYAASCRTALLQKQRQRQQQQQQQQPAPEQEGGAAAPHTVPPSASGKDLSGSTVAAFTPAPPAPAFGRKGFSAMLQQQQQQQQQQPQLQVPPSSTSFATAFTPSLPSDQCTPATSAQPSQTFAASGAAVGGGGLWEAQACPPPLPVRAQRGSSRSAAAAAAAAAAAETPSTHRPAVTTNMMKSGGVGLGVGMPSVLPQQQHQQLLQLAAGFNAGSIPLPDASQLTMSGQLLHSQQQQQQQQQQISQHMQGVGRGGVNGHGGGDIRQAFPAGPLPQQLQQQDDAGTESPERAQQAPLHHGHHQARHHSHILDERGKVRKISGKFLFHESAAGAPSDSLSSGSNTASNSRRRSSRLAAQQQAMQGASTGGGGSSNTQATMGPDPTPSGAGAPLCGPSTHVANTLQQPLPFIPLHLQPTQQQPQQQQGVVRGLEGWGLGCQSQNQPDPSHPPPLPSRTQTTFNAKLAYQPGCMPRTSFAQPVAGRDTSVAEENMGSTRDAEGQVLSMALLEPAFQGYLHLAMYRCTEALQCFRCLQPNQARTAWVWCQVARAYFERMDYSQAAHAFETARQLDKQHLEGMEVYSTVLWHLKRDTDLSYLAQDLVAVDRLAPQTWCVLGNFFSLQREHEAALKLFERSLQLDSTFTYAYTLSGHEHAANDDLDSALTCYRNALRLDGRHYNAMYGMGQLYFRQEKYDVALVHFKSAALVNPQSSVLRCYWGMALAKQGILGNALAKLQEAVDLDPRNPLARYEKAGVLAASGTDVGVVRAVEELEALIAIAPGEASVYFQMGKLYKQLGNLGAAQRQLETALSLNSASSADAGLIKVAIEKLSVNDEEEEEEL
ncbi:hypothetical protein DUNSADRAFT_10043 [Dunaliella salina]|uniref:Uncharacterized protein n=1 Tax=Dunaliella salina TaxID=3046 RepID=A0ABQ7GG70_DUNSA|nr:hypothetical protein DUNSADRAFT_10043 [Dunaliella salina]|eukprot:KAF5833591.1 hypothetical protein DUNSADRAFT_10043 [Dunaliella salina]